MVGTPCAEVEIDEGLVRSLLRAQQPDLADLSLGERFDGWDNATFRLGESLAVRLPRRAAAAPLIVNEQRCLPIVAEWATLPIPLPFRVGKADHAYPWSWSVVPWLMGNPADEAAPSDEAAHGFADFLRALHQPDHGAAPPNAVRGVPLPLRVRATEERFARIVRRIGPLDGRVLRVWDSALSAGPSDDPRWIHGDLHPRNVLVQDGAIRGIIDWGDVTSGDIATDLAATWMLFDRSEARSEVLARYEATGPQTARSKGWAIVLAAALLDTGLVDNPRNARIGATTLRRIAEDQIGRRP